MKGVNKVLCPDNCVYRSRYAPFCGYCTKAILEERELESYGADTEKKITALTYPEIMRICRDSKTLAFQDMEAIVKLQEEIKARRIIPFLLGSEDDETESKSEPDTEKEEADAEDSDEEEDSVAGRQLYGGSQGSERTERVY